MTTLGYCYFGIVIVAVQSALWGRITPGETLWVIGLGVTLWIWRQTPWGYVDSKTLEES